MREDQHIAGEPFGPFRVGADAKERAAQLRTLSALTAARGSDVKLIALLRKAESSDRAMLTEALAAFSLPPLTRRHIPRRLIAAQAVSESISDGAQRASTIPQTSLL